MESSPLHSADSKHPRVPRFWNLLAVHHPFIHVLTTAHSTQGEQHERTCVIVAVARRAAMPSGTITRPARAHLSILGRSNCSNAGAGNMCMFAISCNSFCTLLFFLVMRSSSAPVGLPCRVAFHSSSLPVARCSVSATHPECHSCQGCRSGAFSFVTASCTSCTCLWWFFSEVIATLTCDAI